MSQTFFSFIEQVDSCLFFVFLSGSCCSMKTVCPIAGHVKIGAVFSHAQFFRDAQRYAIMTSPLPAIAFSYHKTPRKRSSIRSPHKNRIRQLGLTDSRVIGKSKAWLNAARRNYYQTII